jgi:hypothetical protein
MLLDAVEKVLAQVISVLDEVQRLPDGARERLYIDENIGRHVRHILDHYLAVQEGLAQSHIDYNLRNRDSIVERSIPIAKDLALSIGKWVRGLSLKNDKVEVHSEIDCFQTVNKLFESTLERELLYLINHTIHHLAFMKLVALRHGVKLPDYVGLAPNTASYVRETNDRPLTEVCAP